jgi:hypothetical protein
MGVIVPMAFVALEATLGWAYMDEKGGPGRYIDLPESLTPRDMVGLMSLQVEDDG